MVSCPRAWVLPLAVAGCTVDGEGDLVLRVSGEQGALQGFPFEPGGGHDGEDVVAFADGWTLSFSKYIAAVGDLEVASSDGSQAVDDPSVRIFDLHAGEPEIAMFAGVGARRWDRFSFSVRAPTRDDELQVTGNVSQGDIDRMVAEGYNYWVEGAATKDGRTVSFAWGFDNPSRNEDCTSGDGGSQGVVVTNNTVATAELTFHVEHMFWDTLGSEQTTLRFDAIAAMADADSVVTLEALADQRLADLRDDDGGPLVDADGNLVVYNPGSSGATNLRELIEASVRMQAHLDGEGLCTIAAL